MNLYRHYKNQTYRYLGLVRHSETLEEMANYECRYENDLGRLWVRPKDMFFSQVEVDGKQQARFAKVEIPIRIQTELSESEKSEVEALATTLFTTWNTAKFREKLASRTRPLLLLAYESKKLVGFKLGFELDGDRFYSWLGGVSATHRGLGIGRALLRKQHELCLERGYREIETKTKNEFKSMLILNLQEGFLVSGLEGDDAAKAKIILRKSLNGSSPS